MERERLVSVIERVSDGRMSADGVADIILSELAAEKPTAPAGLVEELREWIISAPFREGTDSHRAFSSAQEAVKEILSRYSARKEVVLAEGVFYSVRVNLMNANDGPDFVKVIGSNKRGRLVFIEEDGK